MSALPVSISTHLEDRLQTAVLGVRGVSGGDIHRAYRVELADDRRLFVKTSPSTAPGLFAAESEGLTWLRSFAALPVPDVVSWRDQQGAKPGYLALTWHQPTRAGRAGHARTFGRGLAALHDHAQPAPGWRRNVFIGSLPQRNRAEKSASPRIAGAWAEFWITHRLRPMTRLAGRDLDGATRALIDRVCGVCHSVLSDVDHLGPLHGDLWGGNALWTDGGGMLIDPAVYAGDPEVDLAMMALFGGFPADCWDAYFEVRPKAYGFETRRALYQLWPLLVHVALFGRGYTAQVAAAARDVLRGA